MPTTTRRSRGSGRDMASRLWLGLSVSIFISLTASLLAMIIGTVLGIIAGMRGGWVDGIIGRLCDLVLSFPQQLMLLALSGMALEFIHRELHIGSDSGAAAFYVIVVMALFGWPGLCRLVRGQVLALREREFVQAARAFGVRDMAMIRHHIVPNLLGPLIILMALNVATNILLESSLTFLGLGVDPTIPSWGGMLADGRTYLQTAWWVSVFPGLAIMLTVLGLNLLGDWLRDRLDPTGKV